MRWLLIHAHPDPDSYSAALRDAASSGLKAGGADVDIVDLYALGFEPAMSEDEHRRYETVAEDHPDPLVRHHIDLVKSAEGLLFVYPTWWGNVPAAMKGWLDRVLLPDVGFRLNERTRKVEPGLTHVKRLVGVTTYGGARWHQKIMGDGGKTMITRTVRLSCGVRTPTTWLSLDKLDTCDEKARRDFLADVTTKTASL